MVEQAPTKSRRGRKRGARGALRRAQEIDRVHVDKPFRLNLPDHVQAQSPADGRKAGEGCYVSATIHNRRYYGVLIDQASLKAASMLHFQDEAAGLELNRKMEQLKQKRDQEKLADDDDEGEDRKRPAESDRERDPNKRMRLDLVPDMTASNSNSLTPFVPGRVQPVQKFRFVDPITQVNGSKAAPGYRILLATYADASVAAEDDPEKASLIQTACQAGGDYVGDFFYQYETKRSTLEFSNTEKAGDDHGLRMSLGFHSFLQTALLPDWFPLANLPGGQSKVLSLLNMKKDNQGNVVYDAKATIPAQPPVEIIPMEARTRFRVCVVGAGIGGLSCCLELFRICEREKIELEIVLVEGRSRLGGRLWTDRDTFKMTDGSSSPFPVDLGASWIHGIDQNPLAVLAKEAGAEFVTTSEDVKMFQAGMEEVDADKDDRAGAFFDQLLDFAANDSWTSDDSIEVARTKQAAVRWYSSVLGESVHGPTDAAAPSSSPPPHRQSSDISVDIAIGRAILKHRLSEFALLSDQERRMLIWNSKNIEYALGANINDLSMKWWDIDERHAFEGDHVLLKQGYSSVVDHLYRLLKDRGDRFKCILDFPVGNLEYNRKTSKQAYSSSLGRSRRFIELSDTCCVTSQDGSQSIKCDFVVSAVPLGVLKAATMKERAEGESRLSFRPPLPFLKRDAIESVGFGLLNKVYLQFPFPFWSKGDILGPNYTQFGNASGVNPHHYMFLDVGKTLQPTTASPAILMSLISGREAARCEKLTDESLVGQVMETLRTLFSKIEVPDPIAFKLTRWGSDQFSRGCYTFLTPGTTDQDFGILQAPVNGNGDSLLLEGAETMRLFFAGEHTTALHPSMAHGALMSGMRAAKEVVESMHVTLDNDESYDKLMPMPMFRFLNPKKDIRCCLCHKPGMRIREGNLLAFRKGTRHVLVHTNCAENSPEVEVFEGQWKDVFTTVNRSRNFECVLCNQIGASIGCTYKNCDRCYHFSCGEDTGWRFEMDGKEFYCDLHRTIQKPESFRVSMQYFRSKGENMAACELCGSSESDDTSGELLAFMRRVMGPEELAVVHENCIRYTSIIDVGEEKMSGIDKEFRNVFTAIERARTHVCSSCGKPGASVLCSGPSCQHCVHVGCAEKSGWNFNKEGSKFRCIGHRDGFSELMARQPEAEGSDAGMHPPLLSAEASSNSGNHPAAKKSGGDASNGERVSGKTSDEIHGDDDDNDDDDSDFPELTLSMLDESEEGETAVLPSGIPLAPRAMRRSDDSRWISRLVRVSRKSAQDRWNIDLYATCLDGSVSRVLTVARTVPDPVDQLEEGDIVRAINGKKVGSGELNSLSKVFLFLRGEVEVLLEIQRLRRQDNPWI